MRGGSLPESLQTQARNQLIYDGFEVRIFEDATAVYTIARPELINSGPGIDQFTAGPKIEDSKMPRRSCPESSNPNRLHKHVDPIVVTIAASDSMDGVGSKIPDKTARASSNLRSSDP